MSKILTACAIAQLIIFAWLCSLDQDALTQVIYAGDTYEYVEVAQALAQNHELIPSRRTLGYPLFLAVGYALGGVSHGPQIVIAAQLILNLVFTFLCWKLLERMTPNVDIRLRTAATFILFWAGLGIALNLLSDFLASFLFGVFLYGMLFWRRALLHIVSGLCLGLATLARPTFTFVPLLLPLAAYLVGRVTRKVPTAYMIVIVVFSLAATGASITYQYLSFGYLGPSSVVSQNIGRMLSYDNYQEFKVAVAAYAERDAASLSLAEEHKYAVQMFREQLAESPQRIILPLLQTLVKYIFVPIEYVVAKATVFFSSDSFYFASVRPVLFVLCLPIWLFSLVPPFGSSRNLMAYYLIVMILLLYVLGISLHTMDQGERIRFPMLAFMLPIMACNAHEFWRHVKDYLSKPVTAWLH